MNCKLTEIYCKLYCKLVGHSWKTRVINGPYKFMKTYTFCERCKKLWLLLLCLLLLSSISYAIPYRLTTLYAHPNQESQVAYYFPEDMVKIDVLEVRGDWILLRIRTTIPFYKI